LPRRKEREKESPSNFSKYTEKEGRREGVGERGASFSFFGGEKRGGKKEQSVFIPKGKGKGVR